MHLAGHSNSHSPKGQPAAAAEPNTLGAAHKISSSTSLKALGPKERALQIDIEITLIAETQCISKLQVIIAGKRWYVANNIPEQQSKQILDFLNKVAKNSDIEPANVEKLLGPVHEILCSAPNVKLVNALQSVGQLITKDKLPKDLVIPESIQERLAQNMISVGKGELVLENLDLFNARIVEVLRALHRAEIVSFNHALMRTMAEPWLKRVSGNVQTDYKIALNLVDCCLEFFHAGNKEQALSWLNTVLKNSHVFAEGVAGQLVDYLIAELAERDFNTELIELLVKYSETHKDWLDKLVDWICELRPIVRGGIECGTVAGQMWRFTSDQQARLFDWLLYQDWQTALSYFDEAQLAKLDATVIVKRLFAHTGREESLRFLKRTQVQGLGPEIVQLLIKEGQEHELVGILSRFTNLDPSLALKLCETNAQSVFESISSFRWSADSLKTFFKHVFKKLTFEKVFGVIDKIPSRILLLVEDSLHLLEYQSRIGLPLAAFYKGYCTLKNAGQEIEAQVFVKEIQQFIDLLISSRDQRQDYKLFARPYYRDLINYVFPNHSSSSVHFETNELCPDRSSDLAQFTIKPVYRIHLAENLLMGIRDGEKEDPHIENKVNQAVRKIEAEFNLLGRKKSKFAILDNILNALKILTFDQLKAREDKIYVLMLEVLVGRKPAQILKEALLAYHFASHSNIEQYLRGTSDRAGSAPNPRYAHLLYLREFFADEIRDCVLSIARKADQNRYITSIVVEYWAEVERSIQQAKRSEQTNRIQADKLGLSERLMDELVKVLRRPLPIEKKYKAVAGMISTEQKRAAKLVEIESGNKVDPDSIHLANFRAELDLRNQNSKKGQAKSTDFNPTVAKSYLSEILVSTFRDELNLIDRELDKYVSSEQHTGKVHALECFITKNHTSAHARAVAGLCIAGDNPRSLDTEDASQWNLANFFQMVLRDPTSKVCQGVLLLNHYKRWGQKILVVSFQPSSTYLFKVNEKQLFRELLGKLIEFAKDNAFSCIACAVERHIRTNRTQGQFEQAISEQVATLRKQIDLGQDEPFSLRYHKYSLRKLDVLWQA